MTATVPLANHQKRKTAVLEHIEPYSNDHECGAIFTVNGQRTTVAIETSRAVITQVGDVDLDKPREIKAVCLHQPNTHPTSGHIVFWASIKYTDGQVGRLRFTVNSAFCTNPEWQHPEGNHWLYTLKE